MVIKVKKAHDWLIKFVEYDTYAASLQKDLDWLSSDNPYIDAYSYRGLFTTKQRILVGQKNVDEYQN